MLMGLLHGVHEKAGTLHTGSKTTSTRTTSTVMTLTASDHAFMTAVRPHWEHVSVF
jgi:hypothetical protein